MSEKISDLEKLKKIGVKQINEDTKLDIIKISDILEKRFENLDYVRARGFIHILERQYDLNLSDWLMEYYQSCPREERQEENQEVYLKHSHRKKVIAIVAIIVFVCVCFVALQILFKQDSQSLQGMQETLIIPEVDQEFESVKTSQQNQEISPQDISYHQETKSQEDRKQDLKKETSQEKDKQRSNEEQEKQEKKNNQPKQEAKIIDVPLNTLGKPLFEGYKFDSEDLLYLTFKRSVWVGIVRLDSKQRLAQTQEELEIPLDEELLIYVAYGSFTATINEEEKTYNTYKPIFLAYTRKGGLREITKEEFVFFNGGVEW